MSTIAENLTEVRERIQQACMRSGRDTDSVRLIAVTKTVGIDEIRELYACGVRDFGENRVEVLLPKIAELSDLEGIRWHFIGHLQRNKAKKVLGKVAAIHSVEAAGLLDIIADSDFSPDIFIEVNISGEESKYGLTAEQAEELVGEYAGKVHIVGLMTMAPYFTEAEDTRSVFRGLRELRDSLAGRLGQDFSQLSMGMSNDFEVAVEEGATMVRVGSELFK